MQIPFRSSSTGGSTLPQNLITDVPGLRVGNADDAKLASGVTVVVFDQPAVAAADIRGGGAGTRETDLLDPAMTVERIDAIALSGGSAFGLDAGSGVQAWLREQGRGFAVGPARVPIVPGAILFDLLSGGHKAWGRYPPYRELAYAATANATHAFALGTVGAGYGATTVNLKGGLGSASAKNQDGITLGALALVNAAGSVTVGDSLRFWAAPFEQRQRIWRAWAGPRFGAARRVDAPNQRIGSRQHHARVVATDASSPSRKRSASR